MCEIHETDTYRWRSPSKRVAVTNSPYLALFIASEGKEDREKLTSPIKSAAPLRHGREWNATNAPSRVRLTLSLERLWNTVTNRFAFLNIRSFRDDADARRDRREAIGALGRLVQSVCGGGGRRWRNCHFTHETVAW